MECCRNARDLDFFGWKQTSVLRGGARERRLERQEGRLMLPKANQGTGDRKMSRSPLVSPRTRFEASLLKTIRRPSAERVGVVLDPVTPPKTARLMRRTWPVTRSFRKTSSEPF